MRRSILILALALGFFLGISPIYSTAETKETKPINENETLAIIQKNSPSFYEQLKIMKVSNPAQYWDMILILDKSLRARKELEVKNPQIFEQLQKMNNLEPVSAQEETEVLKFLQEKFPDVYSQMLPLKLQSLQAYQKLLAMYKKGIKNQAFIQANFPQQYKMADELTQKLRAQSLQQAGISKNFVLGSINREDAKKKLYLLEYSLIKSMYDKNPVNTGWLYSRMIVDLNQELTSLSVNQRVMPKEIVARKKQEIGKEIQALQKAVSGDLRELADFDVEQQLKALDSLRK